MPPLAVTATFGAAVLGSIVLGAVVPGAVVSGAQVVLGVGVETAWFEVHPPTARTRVERVRVARPEITPERKPLDRHIGPPAVPSLAIRRRRR
jgi:hypothetical protein